MCNRNYIYRAVKCKGEVKNQMHGVYEANGQSKSQMWCQSRWCRQEGPSSKNVHFWSDDSLALFGASSLSTHFSQCGQLVNDEWGKQSEVSSLLGEPHTFIWLGQLLTSLTFTRSHLQVNPPLTKGGLGILCARLRKEAISFLLFIWFPFRLRAKATFKLAYPTSPFIQFGIPYTKLEKAS